MTPDIHSIAAHGGYVLAGALLVLAQASLIAALLASRSRRRATEARNNAILRAIPDLMFLQTKDGVYLDYSSRDPKLFLVPPSQFIGKNMRDVLPPYMQDLFLPAIRRLFDGEEPVVVEYDLSLPSGETRYWEARLVRCESDKFLSIARDITDRRVAELAARDAHAELLRASKLATLGEFAGSIAHELAQPLTAIIANSQASLRILERPQLDQALLRESLNDVLVSGESARDVISHTRNLFRNGEPEQAPISLVDIVNDACVMAHPTLHARNVAMDLKFAPDLPKVRGDRVQLRQVVLNLVNNGIQAMDQIGAGRPRRLSIGASVDAAGRPTVAVRDTGVGLGKVDPHRLFSGAYSTKPDGMGWGLSISRTIIEAHGGRLWAESNEDGGAVFSFSLPLDTTSGNDSFAVSRA